MLQPLLETPLAALHRARGGRMIAFAGWSMPVQFAGTLAEHAAAREGAALFDVSHMGQVAIPAGSAAALERLVPGDILGLSPGQQRYTLLLNESGGIVDDLMVAPHGETLVLVLNASRTEADIAYLQTNGLAVTRLPRALLALQGPRAEAVLAPLCPPAAALPFMGVLRADILGAACFISRSGYTGEDGYEISVPPEAAETLALRLIEAGATPAGLAARDTLRLEAGLPLYGQDIDELTTPVEAGLAWTVAKRRRESADFAGAVPILDELRHGPTRCRVGLAPAGRTIARAGTEIVSEDDALAGTVTSGGFSPTLGRPIATGYVRRDLATPATALRLRVRGTLHAATVAPLPFVPHRYRR